MKMTYRSLRDQLEELDEDQLDSPVSIHDERDDKLIEVEEYLQTVPHGEKNADLPYLILRNL